MQSSSISTKYCDISICQSSEEGVPVLFLHANSACKETFSRQYESTLGRKYRFVAMDFAGHGMSGKAKDAEATYSVPGHAKVVIEVIEKLGLVNPVVVGSSLGGHVGLELLRQGVKLSGLLITGTPPIKFDQAGFKAGFQFKPELAMLFDKPKFTREEAAKFMKAGGFDTQRYPFIVDAAEKVDELARPKLCESNMKGSGGDEKELVETNDTPLCVVQGTQDENINNDYILSLKYKNLFNRKVHILEKAGHSVFWDQPERFNEILEQFIESVTKPKWEDSYSGLRTIVKASPHPVKATLDMLNKTNFDFMTIFKTIPEGKRREIVDMPLREMGDAGELLDFENSTRPLNYIIFTGDYESLKQIEPYLTDASYDRKGPFVSTLMHCLLAGIEKLNAHRGVPSIVKCAEFILSKRPSFATTTNGYGTSPLEYIEHVTRTIDRKMDEIRRLGYKGMYIKDEDGIESMDDCHNAHDALKQISEMIKTT